MKSAPDQTTIESARDRQIVSGSARTLHSEVAA